MPISVTAGSAQAYLKSYLENSTTSYQKAMDELSSGNKYSSISDDPVAVCKSAKLEIKISANSQALENSNLGSDLLTMAEDSQTTVVDNLQRIHTLALQISNGTYSASDKDAIITEIKARLSYINSAADNTSFGKIKLLDGSNSNLQLQIGTSANSRITVGDALINLHTASSGLDVDLPTGVTGSNWTNSQIATYMDKVTTAINTITGAQAKIGGYLNRLDSVNNNLTTINTNLTETKSTIADADVAQVSADLVKSQILQQTSVSILTQANQVPTWVLSLLNAR